MSAIFKALSAETTKLSLAFSKKPYPSFKNTQQMAEELEKRLLTLVSAYYSLPQTEGSTLRQHLQASVLQIGDSIKGFISELLTCLKSTSASGRLQWTGGVWEAADFVILKDNKECVLKDLGETSGMIDDVMDEIEQARENNGQADDFLGDGSDDDDEEEVWSQQDRDVVAACTGLVKTTKTIMKKTRESVIKTGSVETAEGIRDLDELIGLTSVVNSRVDDFVCGIYAPVNYAQLLDNGKVLYELNGNIIKFLRDSSLTTNPDETWLNFLSQANVHNHDKLGKSVIPSED